MRGRWEQQWERALIGLGRVEEIYEGREGGGSEDAVFDLHAFFQAAFHMRDWLANDPTTGLDSGMINANVGATTEFKVCADFANGTKHLELSRPPWIDQQTGVTRQDVTVAPPTAGSRDVGSASHAWKLTAAGQDYDALGLARNVVRIWETFLKTKGLLD